MSQSPNGASSPSVAPRQWRTPPGADRPVVPAAHPVLPAADAVAVPETAVVDPAPGTDQLPDLIQSLPWTATTAPAPQLEDAAARRLQGTAAASNAAAPEAGLSGVSPSAAPVAPAPGGPPALGSLTHEGLVRARPERPTGGWRGAVYVLTGGAVNPGLSEQEATRRQQRDRIRAELAAPHTVVVLSMKGGVGKTTVAALLGQMMAQHRGDQVVAVDANPDAGTLADRILGRPLVVTARDLVNDLSSIHDATDLARYTGLAGRLHVLASEHDPAKSEAFNRQDCEQTIALLRRFFHVVVVDSGTGVTHAAVGAALDAAQSLVVVGAPTVDGASRASWTLDWLDAHGYTDLAANAVAALPADRSSPDVDPDAVHRHFAARCRAVVAIPRDPHLATGGAVDLDLLRPATYDAVLALSAAVADEFHGHRSAG